MVTFNRGKTKKNIVQISVQSLRSGTFWVEVRSLKQNHYPKMVLNKRFSVISTLPPLSTDRGGLFQSPLSNL